MYPQNDAKDALRNEIEAAAKEVEGLLAQLAITEQKELRLRAALAAEVSYPVHTLPAEIVSHIFKEALQNGPPPPLVGHGSPLEATHICTAWRHTLIDDAFFWARFTLGGNLGIHLAYAVDLYLKRSGNCLLDVAYLASTDEELLSHLAFLVSGVHPRRLRAVTSRVPVRLLGILPQPRDYPALVSMDFGSSDEAHGPGWGPRIETLPTIVPSVRTLRLHRVFLPEPRPLTLLVQLIYRGAGHIGTDVWRQLRMLPALEQLGMGFSHVAGSTPPPGTPVSLPHLRSLALYTEDVARLDFLEAFDPIPALRNLTLSAGLVAGFADEHAVTGRFPGLSRLGFFRCGEGHAANRSAVEEATKRVLSKFWHGEVVVRESEAAPWFHGTWW